MKITKSKLFIILLYLLFINEWFLTMPLVQEYYRNFKLLVNIALLIIMLICLIWNKFDYIELFIFLSLALLCTITYYKSTVSWPLYLVILIFISKNIQQKKLIDYYVRIMKFILIINCCIFFVQYFFFRNSLIVVTSRNMLRYSMNFASSANAVAFLIIYVLLRIIQSNGKITKKSFFSHIVLTFLFYYFTRIDTIIVILLMYLMVFLKDYNFMKKLIDYGFVLSIPFYTLFTICSIIFYPKFPFNWLNMILTGRISLQQKAFQRYGLTLLGQYIEYPIWVHTINNKWEFICLDNTFVSFMLNYGIIYLLPFIILPFVCRKNNDELCKLGLCIYSTIAFVLDGMLSPFYVAPLIVCMCSFFHNRRKIEVNS